MALRPQARLTEQNRSRQLVVIAAIGPGVPFLFWNTLCTCVYLIDTVRRHPQRNMPLMHKPECEASRGLLESITPQ